MIDLTKFVEVKLNEQDDFLKVRETLTRIGVSSRKDKVLVAPLHQIKIISFKEKDDWQLVPKYNIGKKPNDSYNH